MNQLFKVNLLPQQWSFEADPGTSLLLAAQAAGIRLPSSCRNGTCRTCLCRVSSGQASHSIAWPGLSPEEKRDGYILPCVARAESDLELETPAARRI